MTLFQILSVGVLCPLYLVSLWRAFRGKGVKREGLASAVVCFAAAVAILWPDITVRIAQLLGIDRGADLVLYMSVFAMMAGFWLTYMHVRGLNSQITTLVRQLAMMDAEKRDPRSS